MILGVIADDFTGATDIAGMLVRAGMRTEQLIGVPGDDVAAPDADAVVVALKTRTIDPDEAVAQSLAALAWLRAAGARHFVHKICSTFDSTPRGNIGPVAEAFMDALDAPFAIACPAFPENGRSVWRGHLFVGDALLSDTGMRDHPLTPMTDANLVRVLQAQCTGRVGLLRHDRVTAGADALRAAARALQTEGVRIAIADAVGDEDLHVLAEAFADLPLVVAGSGLALGLPAAWARRGRLSPDNGAAVLPEVGDRAAVVSGSCSQATLAQVAHWRAQGLPAHAIDAESLEDERAVGHEIATALAWASPLLPRGPVLVHASAAPESVRATQAAFGAQAAGERVERVLAGVAVGLQAMDVRRLVVAGGETSGAVVQALGVRRLRIGAFVVPGVPWTQAAGRSLLLALKSGNFGGPDFFIRALAQAR